MCKHGRFASDILGRPDRVCLYTFCALPVSSAFFLGISMRSVCRALWHFLCWFRDKSFSPQSFLCDFCVDILINDSKNRFRFTCVMYLSHFNLYFKSVFCFEKENVHLYVCHEHVTVLSGTSLFGISETKRCLGQPNAHIHAY